jgi:hypothetical protein
MKYLIVWVVALLAACTNQPAREYVGRLDVDGPNAFLNGQRTADGARVYIGDRVSTGFATSVKVFLQGGGYVQLDQNTDPDFLREGGCLIIQILTGRVFIDGTGVCIETPSISARQASQIHYAVSSVTTETVVLAGSVAMRRPAQVMLGQYDYYVVSGNQAQAPRRLTPQAAFALAAWRANWDFRPTPAPTFPTQPTRPGPSSATTPTVPPQPPQAGFHCCLSRQLVPLSENQCLQRNGRYFRAPAAEAAQMCRGQ